MNALYPCIWFDNNAKDAAGFYCDVFNDCKIISETSIVIMLALNGQKFMLLNGGPAFKPNPSISFMMSTYSAADIEKIWDKLLDGGKVLMELDSYPWSPKYGWIEDKYGVSWQLYHSTNDQIVQKYVPTLMFTGAQNGRAEEAMNFYTSIFPDSSIRGILKYNGTEGEVPDNVQHADFIIHNYQLMCMDSSADHKFNFTEGVSLVVHCKDQSETDTYWNALIADGGAESQCGWLKDKFGLSWQIVPQRLMELVSDSNKEKSGAVMKELMKMKKIEIGKLEAVFEQ